MTNSLRLLLMLLMGGSLLAARWTDALGQRPPATAVRLPLAQPRPVVQARPFWLPVGSWPGLAQPVDQPGQPGQAPTARAL